MLAPRKKLHSSPSSVLDLVSQWIAPLLKPGDVVCDIGCGDGRVLLHLAKVLNDMTTTRRDFTTTPLAPHDVSFVGIDINPDRIQEATTALQSARQDGIIHPDTSVTFHCANAMESIQLYQDATIVFLYLIPRGLKIFKPMLYQVLQQRHETKTDTNPAGNVLQVMTYMAPLPEETYTQKATVQVEHQPGAAWPVYFYELQYTPPPPLSSEVQEGQQQQEER